MGNPYAKYLTPGTTQPRLVIPAAEPKPGEVLRDKRTTQEIENNPLDVEVKRQSLKKSRTDQALSMAQDYNSNPDVKAYNSILPTYAAALESPDTPAGDQGLVYAMAKVMQADGSAVRSEEVQNTESLQPYVDQIKAQFGKQLNADGTFLPSARQQIRQAMAQKMGFLNRAYINQRVRYKEQADRAGLDPRDVVGDHTGIGFQDVEAKFLGHPVSQADYRGNVIPSDNQPPWSKPAETPQNSPEGTPPSTESGLQRFSRDGLGGSSAGDRPLDVEITDDRLPGETDEQYAARAQKESGSQQAQTDKARDTPLGAIDATIRGATDSLTLGSSDEITGFMNALGTGDLSKRSINSEIQRQRDIDAADSRVNPWARMGGQFAGGLLLPYSKGSILKTGAQGAALGGAYGFGSGEGGVIDRLPSAASGAVVGGALGAGVPAAVNTIAAAYSKVKAPVTAARDAAERLNINSTPAATGGAMSRGLQMAYGNLPGSSAAVESAAARETGDLANAARTVANDLGPVSNPKGAGKALSRGAGAWQRVTKAEAQRLYGERDKLMGGPDVPIVMAESRAAIDSFAQRFPNSPVLATLRESPAVRRLEKAMPDKGVLTLKESTELLSEARAALRNARRKGDATPAMEKRIADVEQAIENDVMNAARQVDQAAGRTTGGAADAQMTADKYYRNRAILKSGALKLPLSSRMDDVLASSESVYRDLSGDMAEKGGNFAKLQATWKALPTGAKRNFAATKFDEMGKATNGQQNADKTAWSFNTFLTNYSSLNADARKLVFGAQEDKIRDIATYAERLRQVDKSRNFSNTAKNTIAGAFMTVLGGALWKGDVQTAAATVAAVPAAWGSAKLFLSTPAMRAWTARALKATQQAANTGNAAPLKSLTGQLAGVAAREPAISGDVISLQNYLAAKFSESPSRAAATPGQDRNDRRPPPENNGQ